MSKLKDKLNLLFEEIKQLEADGKHAEASTLTESFLQLRANRKTEFTGVIRLALTWTATWN